MTQVERKALAGLFPHRLVETSDASGRPKAGFVAKGFKVFNPRVSEDGQQKVSPDYYGLTTEQVVAIDALNKKIEAASQGAMDAGARAIQDHLGVTTGDLAGVFFSGENSLQIERVLLRYALTEVASMQEDLRGDAS